MTDGRCRSFERWFAEHVRSFREPDPIHQRSLDLKEEHTSRVCAAMDRITAALGLAEEFCRLARLTALFHDLGRFPQYQRYRTFRDRDSDNHAKLSIRELNRHQVLHSLNRAERQLICRAIIFHNRLTLPMQLDAETLLLSRLIRDADKVDILRVMAEEYRKPDDQRNPVVTLGLGEDCGVREEVYDQLFAGRIMNYLSLRNNNEFKVLQMSWVFDINFRPTFEILQERDDIGAIAATLPDTPRQRQALELIKATINRRLTL